MDQIVWIDIDRNDYGRGDLTDRHLLNILHYIGRGNIVWDWFTNEKVIYDLYSEAINRVLKPRTTLKELLKNSGLNGE